MEDYVAQAMALAAMAKAEGGGTSDSYTKSETDSLLNRKADLVDGKIPAAELPSYVDDVVEYASTSAFPATGESGKIYIATDTNKTYRWGGSAYVEISESLALGETASTAYPGNKGKANADAIAKKPGEITTGKQYTIDGRTVTAGNGAEAFNDLVNNKASGLYSHAEGVAATASGPYSHAEGQGVTASGDGSHAEGYGTKASSASQHVQGKFNVEDANGTYAFIIGNGTGDNARHNAFAIDWNGLIYVNGAATGVDVSQLTPVTVDQSYSASSANAQSGTAVAQALGTIPSVTVDQTYDATSTNAQSGVAIAGVIGNINAVLEEVL